MFIAFPLLVTDTGFKYVHSHSLASNGNLIDQLQELAKEEGCLHSSSCKQFTLALEPKCPATTSPLQAAALNSLLNLQRTKL